MNIIWTYRVYADAKNHITTWRETYSYLKVHHKIHYIFPYKSSKNCFTEDAFLIKKIPIPGLAVIHYIIASLFALIKLSIKNKPDLVILDYWTAFHSFIYLFFRHKPMILLDFRDPKHNDSTHKSNFIRKLYSKWILIYNARYQDGISYISEGLKKQMETDFKTVNSNFLIWPSGVNTNIFHPTNPLDKTELLSVFFHGSVTPNRGLAETIQALSILKSKKVPFRFTIIGDGNYLSFLKKKVISLELDDYVIFREPEDYNKMPYYISKADICTMAYPTGGFWEGNVPLKLLEYMAMGKVVLCSNLKVFKDISKEAKFALFIDDNSPEKIAEALIFAWINKDSLHEWGVSGCEIVSKEYTWEAISNNIHSYITSMGSTKLIL